ncbi:MAG: tannase/feruloyl esterase family alpha/beta hydrolase [Cytophagales bacterium]|nr:tannase/feruloyl esterase family alpha/beta hydrolase [Cytophagales bacterium]
MKRNRLLTTGAALLGALWLGACSTTGSLNAANTTPQQGCEALAGRTIAADRIGASANLKSGIAQIDSAAWTLATPLLVAPGGPTPAARINAALPNFCKVLGRIKPIDTTAPDILFQVNLPQNWNGKSMQYGGGGFNGVLINALALLPAAPFDQAVPLAQGYVTVGTDSGHQNKAGQPPQAFALNDEALDNFFHASYKKVRDVAAQITSMAYGRTPDKYYFFGSSEGGREGLMLAQRYPQDFNGIFSRVPVIHWTGLQHKGLQDGKALMNGGWMAPAQVKLVGDAVLKACDALDGAADGIVADPVACRTKFDVRTLQCTSADTSNCLTAAQVNAAQTLYAPLRMPFALANGLTDYPGRGPSAEAIPAAGPTGGWMAWWTGAAAPDNPPKPNNGIAWFYGAGAIQYFYARNPKLDITQYKAEDYADRVRFVSAQMDATNPDLSAFANAGGKLIMLENLGDYAQSPYAGIQYFESVQKRMGTDKVATFAKLYTAPHVDHVGSGAPANADFLSALVNWVERGQAPAPMQLHEQGFAAPFTPIRSRPLCEWPLVTRYKAGDLNAASSFACER